MVREEDLQLFGDMLKKARSLLPGFPTVQKIAKNIGRSFTVVRNWENYFTMPPEDLLPIIAKVYQIEIYELEKVHRISKNARREQVIARKSTWKKYKKPLLGGFPEPDAFTVSRQAFSEAQNVPKLRVPHTRSASYYKRNF